MKTMHTPGPWEIRDTDNAIKHIDKGNLCIATVWSRDKDVAPKADFLPKEDIRMANAILIEAAPEMLEALLALLPYLQNYLEGKVHDPAVAIWADEHTEGNFRKAIAVINKATGKKEGVK